MRDYAQNFSKDELLKFLRAIDRGLNEPVELTIIGGAAAALHYGLRRRLQMTSIRGTDCRLLYSKQF